MKKKKEVEKVEVVSDESPKEEVSKEDSKQAYREAKLAKRAKKKEDRKNKVGRYAENPKAEVPSEEESE